MKVIGGVEIGVAKGFGRDVRGKEEIAGPSN